MEKNFSSLEKIKKLKKESAEKKDLIEQTKKIQTEKEESAKFDLYNTAKDKLEFLKTRKLDIEKRLEEISHRRNEIMNIGHQARVEAAADPEVEAVLHTPEGFNEVFATEKDEWQVLRSEVDNLNQELKELSLNISEQEVLVSNLYTDTKEGRELLAQQAAEEKNEKLTNLKKQLAPELKDSIYYYNNNLSQSTRWSQGLHDTFTSTDDWRHNIDSLAYIHLRGIPRILASDQAEAKAANTNTNIGYEAFADLMYEKLGTIKSEYESKNVVTEVKQEMASRLERSLFKNKYNDELDKITSMQRVNNFIEKNKDDIQLAQEKLQTSLQALKDQLNSIFTQAEQSEEYKNKFSDLNLEQYRQLIPEAEKIEINLYNYSSHRIEVPMVKQLAEKLAIARNKLDKDIEMINKEIFEKNNKLIKFGLDKLRKEKENLENKREFLSQLVSKVVESEYNIPDFYPHGKEKNLALLNKLGNLIHSFNMTYPHKDLFNKNAIPDFNVNLTKERIFGQMKMIDFSEEQREVLLKKEELDKAVKTASQLWEEKLKS